MKRLAFWRRIPTRAARVIKRVAIVVLALAVGWAVYQGLQRPSRESHDIRQAQAKLVEDLRHDNAALCEFFRVTDVSLNSVTRVRPTTAAGVVIRESLKGVQVAARNVAASTICPPPAKGRKP